MTEILLGPEHDDELLSRLVAVIEAMGGSVVAQHWSMGGSQEVSTLNISLPDGVLEAETETYVGLSLRGDSPLVETIADRVAATRRR